MVKQTEENNNFLKQVKKKYNNPTFKRVARLVNDGEKEVAIHAIGTGLIWLVGGIPLTRKLIEKGITVEKANELAQDNIDDLWNV